VRKRKSIKKRVFQFLKLKAMKEKDITGSFIESVGSLRLILKFFKILNLPQLEVLDGRMQIN
jgi:hypothetical protein